VSLIFADSVTVSSSPRNVREDALARSGYVFVHPPLLVLKNSSLWAYKVEIFSSFKSVTYDPV
jgi:hypothetical protein